MENRRICVFSSSSNHIEKCYFDEARLMGRLIGENGYDLVHGAGKLGLMGAVSEEAKMAGSHVIGVIPRQLNNYGVVSELDDELIIARGLSDRKSRMINLAHAFVALPGGYGSLDELLEVLTLKQLGLIHKPIGILNTNHFFSPLFKLFNRLQVQNFIKEKDLLLFKVMNSPHEVIDYFNAYFKKNE